MNKATLLLASVAAFTLAAPAFAASEASFKSETKIEKDAKGNYEQKVKVKKTDEAGTTTTSEKKVDVDVKADGSTDTTVSTEAVKDPKGLLNKEEVTTKAKIVNEADGSYDEKVQVKHTDAAGTTTSSEKKVDVDMAADGSADATVKTKVVTDPKGLLNKETVKTTDKAETEKDGSLKTTHKKTVNGKTVESTSSTKAQ